MADSLPLRLLIVGGWRRDTGGISQYIRGQHAELGDDLSVTVHNTSSPPGRDSASRRSLAYPLWFALAGLWALGQFSRFPFRERPDVVHVHASSQFSFYRASLYILFATAVWDVPTVLHIHGSNFDDFLREDGVVRHRFVRWILSMPDEVIVLSEYWQDVFRETTAIDDPIVLANPVAADKYAPQFDPDPVRIVYLSNMVERKGVAEFVTAVERLETRTETEYEVVIAGEGPQSDRVAELAAERDNVEYLGFVDEATKRELLSNGSIFVLPSAAEGLPFSLLEAMAGGNAIVATEVGSIPEVVGRKHGLLVSPIDVDELTESLTTLLEDGERRTQMAEVNHELIRSQYSWQRIATELETLYEELASDGRAETGR
jgi:glycosyltransferase involved in cell wall biosynthesis